MRKYLYKTPDTQPGDENIPAQHGMDQQQVLVNINYISSYLKRFEDKSLGLWSINQAAPNPCKILRLKLTPLMVVSPDLNHH